MELILCLRATTPKPWWVFPCLSSQEPFLVVEAVFFSITTISIKMRPRFFSLSLIHHSEDRSTTCNAHSLPDDLIRPTLSISFYAFIYSAVKRAFFATLLYIYLSDPLLFIRGHSLFDAAFFMSSLYCRHHVVSSPSSSLSLPQFLTNAVGSCSVGVLSNRTCLTAFRRSSTT